MPNTDVMSCVRREAIIVAFIATLVITLIWLTPAVGFVASAVLVAVIAPWGRSLSERMIISGIVVLATVAVVFPRASQLPITPVSTRLFISVVVGIVVVGAIGLGVRRAITKTSGGLLPRATWIDLPVFTVLIIGAWWPIKAFLGGSPQQILSALFFGGWDNAAHFLTFANTYEQGSTLWTSVDGGVAWNQWYPSLQTTLYAVMQQAAGLGGLSREGLLFPYTVWVAVSFAASMAVLTWIAGDLTSRWLTRDVSARLVALGSAAAATATGAWALLGSPQFLLNAGFLNFLMGVALVATAAYLASRSWSSARTLGWFLIPLAAIGAIGLWTPLVLFLVPAAVVVLIALWRWNRVWGALWVLANIALAGWLAWVQVTAILFALDDSSVAEFGEHIGRVGTGMAQFNVGAALAAPIIGLAAAVLLRNRMPLPVAVAAPGITSLMIAGFFAIGSSTAGTSLLRSYYVLKSLDAGLLAVAPIIASVVAVGAVMAIRQISRISSLAVITIGGLLALTFFGYVGAAPQGMSPGFSPAPGVQASWVRANGMQDNLVGESILAGVSGGKQAPDKWPLLWDGAGQLVNLWVAALSGAMSAEQSQFYFDVGDFPYGTDAATTIRDRILQDPDANIAVVWYRTASGEFLQPRLGTVEPRRLILVQKQGLSPALCEDC